MENETGADVHIGIQTVKAAPVDGDTLIVTTGPTMWLHPMTRLQPCCDPYADFTPLSRLCRFEFRVAVANYAVPEPAASPFAAAWAAARRAIGTRKGEHDT